MTAILEEFNAVILKLTECKHTLKVLEGGCGSVSNVVFGNKAYVVGIDISEAQLSKNEVLREKIHGDIQTYSLPKSEFDVVVCWDVLEHLKCPVRALENFTRTLKIDGIMVLAFPNVASIKGVFAKFTPLWFHKIFYRIAYGEKYLMPGYEPFPTFLRWELRPVKIRSFAEENGLIVEYFRTYESGFSNKIRKRLGLTGNIWHIFKTSIQFLSIKMIDAEKTDCLLILRKIR